MWQPHEDILLNEAIREFGNKWIKVERYFTKRGIKRTTSSFRNRMMRIRNGESKIREKKASHICRKCGLIRRGHTCGVKAAYDGNAIAAIDYATFFDNMHYTWRMNQQLCADLNDVPALYGHDAAKRDAFEVVADNDPKIESSATIDIDLSDPSNLGDTATDDLLLRHVIDFLMDADTPAIATSDIDPLHDELLHDNVVVDADTPKVIESIGMIDIDLSDIATDELQEVAPTFDAF